MDYSKVRTMFGGDPSPSQRAGCEAVIAACVGLPKPYVAYALGTVFHECAKTMVPITEMGPRAYFDKYEAGTEIGKRLGNTKPGDGYLFRGRGYVQLTGRANYYKAMAKLGVDLIGNPELALDQKVAAKILALGCCEGWFTGKRFADYLDGAAPDYVNARRIINGTDRAMLVATYAKTFEAAL